MSVRVVLVTGPDASSVTVTAAATAVRFARGGTKVRLVELSPGGLAEVIGSPGGLAEAVGAEPAAGAEALAEPVSGLTVGGFAPRASLARRLAPVVAGLGADPSDWPGTEPVARLLALRDVVRDAPADVIVIDAGPEDALIGLAESAHTLPAAMADVLPRVAGLAAAGTEAGTSSAWQSVVRGVGSALGIPAVAGWTSLLGVLSDAADDVRAVRDLLTDASRCSVQVVVPATRFGASRLRRAVPVLALHRLAVAEVVSVGPDPSALASARAALDSAVWRSWSDTTPVCGPAGVTAVGDAVWPDGAEPASGGAPLAARTERDGDEYVLVLPLLLVDASTVTAGRRGDDLELAIGEYRSVLPLPSLLRRCAIAGGAVSDGALRVRFRPDPSQWPSGLT